MADSEDFKVLSLKMDQLYEVQERSDQKISDVREKLYNPDEGIYSRIKSLNGWAEKHEQIDEDRHREIISLASKQDENNTNINDLIASMAKTMEPLVEDYKIRVKRKKWMDKIYFLLISLTITILLPKLFEVFRTL